MYEYQDQGRYFAQIGGSLEADGSAELGELGATEVQAAPRGASFRADPRTLYRICYASRLVGKVLAPLVSFRCGSGDDLYAGVRDVDWRDFLSVDATFAVTAHVHDSAITHSQYAALRVKDAIVDQFRERTGKRPSVDRDRPEVRVSVHVGGMRATVSVEVTGGSLHRRGYRRTSVEAPMQETLAAAVIRFTG